MSGVELGGQNVEYNSPGDEVAGEVLSAEMVQQRDMDTNEPLYWDAEKTRPKEMIKVQLHAPGHKDAGPDGVVTDYISGSKWVAVKKVTSRIDPGGWLRIKYTQDSDREPPKKGWNRAKLYEAEYKAPGTWKGASLSNDEPPF